MAQFLLSFFNSHLCNLSSLTFSRFAFLKRDEEVKKAVTVLVPMRNEAENVPEFISALVSQMGVKKLKFIIINDGSTDKTAELT